MPLGRLSCASQKHSLALLVQGVTLMLVFTEVCLLALSSTSLMLLLLLCSQSECPQQRCPVPTVVPCRAGSLRQARQLLGRPSLYSLERCSGLPESLAGAPSCCPLLPGEPFRPCLPLSLPRNAAGMLRLWIFPVAPLGSLSVMKICSGTCAHNRLLTSCMADIHPCLVCIECQASCEALATAVYMNRSGLLL